MEKKIEDLLEAIANVVNDNSMRWSDKKLAILRIAVDQSDDTALEEFISWFEKGEE